LTPEPLRRTANETQTQVDLAVVDRPRAICLELPGAVEKEAWGDPTFRVNGRMFLANKFGRGMDVHVAAPAGAQEALVAANPGRLFLPPYSAGMGWIGVRLDTSPYPDWDELAFLAAQGHDYIATKPRRR
jgi:hypothetical protein